MTKSEGTALYAAQKGRGGDGRGREARWRLNQTSILNPSKGFCHPPERHHSSVENSGGCVPLDVPPEGTHHHARRAEKVTAPAARLQLSPLGE